jgi:hypothetical protein
MTVFSTKFLSYKYRQMIPAKDVPICAGQEAPGNITGHDTYPRSFFNLKCSSVPLVELYWNCDEIQPGTVGIRRSNS